MQDMQHPRRMREFVASGRLHRYIVRGSPAATLCRPVRYTAAILM